MHGIWSLPTYPVRAFVKYVLVLFAIILALIPVVKAEEKSWYEIDGITFRITESDNMLQLNYSKGNSETMGSDEPPDLYFDHLSGKKKYDFRLADFDINEGDILVLKEWDKGLQSFTGREIEKDVLYVGKTKGDTTWSQADIDEYGYQIISFE